MRTLNRHKLSHGHRHYLDQLSSSHPDAVTNIDVVQLNDIESNAPHNSFIEANPSVDDLSSSLSSVCLFSACSKTQTSYFHDEHHNSNGLDRLVSNALYSNPEMSYLLENGDVEIHLTLANLFAEMVGDHQSKLARVFYLLDRKCSRVNCNVLQQSKIPLCLNDVRKQYTSNACSIIQNLPMPSVSVDGFGRHAYVSLIECIQDLIGHSLSTLQPIVSNLTTASQFPYNCARAQTILHEGSRILSPMSETDLIMFLYEWADAFGPSNSCKDNRGSAWAKTVTISYNPNICVEGDNTYVISIGPASDCHEQVEQQFAKDLELARSGKLLLYSAKHKMKVRVYADILVSLKDQPERRSSNCILLGSSNYTARWGYSGDLYQAYKLIPSCLKCQVMLRNNITQNEIKCLDCLNWETQNIQFNPPEGYPTEKCKPGQKLHTSVINYQTLIENVRFTTEKLNQTNIGRWSTSNARQYLKVMGLNTDTVSAIIKKAKETLDASKWRIPSLWSRDVPFDAHIDVPMHLLCLGIIKSVVILIHDWAVAWKKGHLLGLACESNLEIIKHMHMSWAPAVPYSNGKLGGWVSENFLVLCKIMPWFYLRFCNNSLDTIKQQQELQLLATTIRAMMSRIMLQETTEDNIIDTHRHIKLFLNAFVKFEESFPTQKPVVLRQKDTKRKKTSVKYNPDATGPIIAQVESIHDDTITNLTPNQKKNQKQKKSSINVTNEAVTLNVAKDVYPRWLTKYNFLCLLNIPDTLRKYGPIRNYWEGGVIGEKIIQQPKNKWRGFTKNWSQNMTKSVHRDSARKKINRRLQQYINETTTLEACQEYTLIDEDDSDEDTSDNNRDKHFKKYVDAKEVKRYFNERVALSAIRTVENKLFIVTSKRETCELTFSSSQCVRWGGDYYYSLELNEPNTLTQDEMSQFLRRIEDSCLILPAPYVIKKNHIMTDMESSTQKEGWTIVTSTWLYVNNKQQFTIPYLLNHRY